MTDHEMTSITTADHRGWPGLLRAALGLAVLSAGLAVATPAAHAQGLKQTKESAAATARQTIGNTEVTVVYHRPSVKGRAIWGALVPYDQVWRAGANENTKIVFSTDVKVSGKPLPAGTYGLHTIPTAKDWTVIFSKVSDAWGSYTYDPKQDALRVTVTPRAAAAPQERLVYRFEDLASTKATLVLAWEKLALPIAIEVEATKPQDSPAARVDQTIGVTDVTVTYHRPGVKGRAIWGELVPYGKVWRAGANENTTIAFSTDAKVNGKPLKAGTYGLHVIPDTKAWTVIFSSVANAWGSFSYDPKQDALRVTVAPRPAPLEEHLLYRFDDVTDSKGTLVLAWEKLALPLAIEVDTQALTMAGMRAALADKAAGSWQAWSQAASYWRRNGGKLDEALAMADRSIQIEANYVNLNARAAILDQQGKTAAAKQARAQAEPLAKDGAMVQVGFGLLTLDKQVDAAIALFRAGIQRFPESADLHEGLGEALLAKGDKPGAATAYKGALALAKTPAEKQRLELVIAQLKR